jgi:hypothetical protein
MAEAKQVDFLLDGVRHPLTDQPLTGGLVYTYEAGTSTPANLYVARDTVEGEATNPIILDAFGRAEAFGDGVYKFVIKDASDNETLLEVDGLEYKAAISDTSQVPLTSNLDFNGNKGVNLAPGTVAGNTVEYTQFVDAIDAVSDDLNAQIATVEGTIAAQSFIGLPDTPAAYTGQAEKLLRVNTGATAVEFLSPASLLATGSLTQLSDTPAAYTGAANKALMVNPGETAVTFGYPDAKTIQGTAVSAVAPTSGQALVLSGSVWTPTTIAPEGAVRQVLFQSPGLGSQTDIVTIPGDIKFLVLCTYTLGSAFAVHITIDWEAFLADGLSAFLFREGTTDFYWQYFWTGYGYFVSNAYIRHIIGYR